MTPKRQDVYTILIVSNGFYVYDTTIIFGFGLTLIKHRGSYVNGVANEHGIQVFNALVIQISDGLSAHIGNCDTYSK